MVREATTKDDIIKVQHAYDALEEQFVVGPDRVLRGLKREWPTFPFGRDAIWYVLDRLKPAASPEDIRVHYGSGRGRKTTKVAPELFQKIFDDPNADPNAITNSQRTIAKRRKISVGATNEIIKAVLKASVF